MQTADIMDDPYLRQLVENCHIDVPEKDVVRESEMLEMELKHSAQYGMMRGEVDIVTIQGEMEERLREIPNLAYRIVKTEIVLERMIKQLDIRPSRDELEAEARAIGRRKDIPENMLRKFFGEDYGLLIKDLQIRKVLDILHKDGKF